MSGMISIIVPVYNAEKYLCNCIESLINQTYENIEIILIDDGSKDKSADICDRYADNEKIKVIHKENGGVQSARTEGLKIARGEYITFVDADDMVHPKAYELCSKAFEQFDCELCFFRYTTQYGEKYNYVEVDSIIEDDYKFISENSLYENYMNNIYLGGFIWNKVWKKECLKNISFRTDMQICEDAVFVWDSLQNVKSAVCIEKELYLYRYLFTSMTRNSSISKYMAATKAWDYLQEKAMACNSSSLPKILINKVNWNLKAADCLVHMDKKKYVSERDTIVNNLKEAKKHNVNLPMYLKVQSETFLISSKLYVPVSWCIAMLKNMIYRYKLFKNK